MAKVQTRRTISINRRLHERTSSDAILLGVPMSQLCEIALERLLELPDDKIADLARNHVARFVKEGRRG